jgi:hypothetical protein
MPKMRVKRRSGRGRATRAAARHAAVALTHAIKAQALGLRGRRKKKVPPPIFPPIYNGFPPIIDGVGPIFPV